MDRRHFVLEGPDPFRDRLVGEFDEHIKKLDALVNEFGFKFFMHRNYHMTAILVPKEALVPDGFKVDHNQLHNGVTYQVCFPRGNTKAGREATKKIRALGGFNVSEKIVRHYGVEAMLIEGGHSHHSVGWLDVEKQVTTLSVPVDPDRPIQVPPGFREIKKSEYIAITEE